MKVAAIFLSLLPAIKVATIDDPKNRASRLHPNCEVVMPAGTRVTATTPVGTIAVTAVGELTRSYAWDGESRTVEMLPRTRRWNGSLGLFNPGAGEQWRDHHGITRCVTQEGQQHFQTINEALKWIQEQHWAPFVYRRDGLMVGWDKNLARKQLSVEVWQILIGGKKPQNLPGSQDEKIIVDTPELEAVPLVKAVACNDLKAVRALLANGANANVKNCVNVPVLVTAIRLGSAPMVEALLKSKADPNVRDIDTDLTPLLQAFDLPEMDATRRIVKILLAAGADANAASRKEDELLMGLTPLMAAAEAGCEDIVQLLLEKGADVNAEAKSGFTALSLAESSVTDNKEAIIRTLRAAGARR